jgi:hypothetical protein
MLGERHDLDGDQAFEMLVTSSRRTDMRLVDIASWVVGEAEQRRSRRERPIDD